MSKKRKTRKEKELSRLRQEVKIQKVPDPMAVSYSVASIKPKEKAVVIPPNQQGTGFIKNHEYVMHDVKHTLIASGILVVLYAILFIFKDYFFSLIIH